MTAELRVQGGRRDAEGENRLVPPSALRPPPRRAAAPWSPPAVLALALAVAVLVLGVRFGSRTAGGSDSYGYVSQADLWLRGNLHVEQPAAAQFAWPDAPAALAPLAYRPATRPGAIVPTYPPGYPLLMAAFSLAGGSRARYLVVPLMGALGVWLTWRFGRRALGETGGLLVALLVASSPPFVFHLLQPMSDVPAMTACVAALVLALGPPPRPLLAGLASGLAILIRPNLAPIALVPALLTWLSAVETTKRFRQVFVFAAGVLPAIVVYAMFNAALYGGPLRSGYGSYGELFALRGSGGTLLHYLRLLVDAQTPFVVLALVGSFVLGKGRDDLPSGFPVLLVGIVCLLLGVYAFYARFEDWTYLRYLLPAYPAIFVLAVGGLQWLSARCFPPSALRLPPFVVTILVCLVVAALTWRIGVERDVFGAARLEARYERVAAAVSRLTPPNAAVLADQHSGSLRYYASRLTVRYELVRPEALDRVLADLRAAGHPPYILLEGHEVEAFRNRFGGASAVAQLDRSPIARLWPRPAVFLYDAQDAGLPSRSGASR